MKCNCDVCRLANYDSEDYYVDRKIFEKGRSLGVSGILRVHNDAEFISASIDSCIEALDELIIVYNDCTDDSPTIIKNMSMKYPNKIHVYEYKPCLFGNNLTKEEFLYAQSLSDDSIHLLSNYYNYALSKSTCKYVLKIDADQIYYKERLSEICNLYRNQDPVSITLRDFYHIIAFIANLFVGNRLGVSFSFINKKKLFERYRTSLLKFISKYKVGISMSGINLFYYKGKWFVPMGKVLTDKLAILSPYNGVGDHLIFEVNAKTFFVPYNCPEYNLMTTQEYSLIEYLQGVKWKLPLGFFWFHLNSNRCKSYVAQVGNFMNNKERFMSLDAFMRSSFISFEMSLSEDLLTRRQRNSFSYLHDGDALSVPICQIEMMKRDGFGYFVS